MTEPVGCPTPGACSCVDHRARLARIAEIIAHAQARSAPSEPTLQALRVDDLCEIYQLAAQRDTGASAP